MTPPQASTLPAAGVTETTPRTKAKLGSLRALWPFVRRHMGLFVSWLVALAVASAATLSLPHAFKQMIDHGFSNASGADIDKAFLGVFAVVVVLAVASAARFFFVSLLGERVVADLRRQLYAHLLALDAQFHDRNRSGELISRLSADSELLRSVVGSAMSVAVRSSVTAIGSVVMMFVASPRMAAFALIGIPVAVIPIILGARRLGKMSRASQDRVADANALAGESLGAVRTVQAQAREPYERSRFESAVATSVDTARRRIRAQSLVTASAITLVFGAIVLVLWSGAHDVIAGQMSAGTLAQFVLYALIGGGSIGSLAEVWNELQRAAGGMGRIGELLDETPQVRAPAKPLPLPLPVRGQIRFDHVTFRYPSRPDLPALEDFTLSIEPGETVALVGPSGAGKSTVLSLLLRFYDVQAGASGSTDWTCASWTWRRCASRSRWSRRRRRSSLPARPRTSATASSRRPSSSCTRLRSPPKPTASCANCRKATTASWASAARACPAVSSSASPLPGPCSRTRRSCCWTRPPAPWTRRASAPCRAHWNG